MSVICEVVLEEFKKRIKIQNFFKYCLVCEVIMCEFVCYFEQDMDKWGICGFVYDIDYEDIKNDLSVYSLVGVKILEDLGFDKDIVYVVKVYNDVYGFLRFFFLDKVFYCVDLIFGFIVVGVLILLLKKFLDVIVLFLLNRFNEKSFVKGVNREQMKVCFEFGFEFEEFLRIFFFVM